MFCFALFLLTDATGLFTSYFVCLTQVKFNVAQIINQQLHVCPDRDPAVLAAQPDSWGRLST